MLLSGLMTQLQSDTSAMCHKYTLHTAPKHTRVADPSDLLPVRSYSVPVGRLYKGMDPVSGHASNETQAKTRL